MHRCSQLRALLATHTKGGRQGCLYRDDRKRDCQNHDVMQTAQIDILCLAFRIPPSDPFPSQSAGNDVGGDGRKVKLARVSPKPPHPCSPSTPGLEFDPSPTAGVTGEPRGDADNHQPRDALQSPENGFWSANIRRPKAGERVQVTTVLQYNRK